MTCCCYCCDWASKGFSSLGCCAAWVIGGQTVVEDDVLTIGGADITLNGGTLKDQGATPADASLVLSGLTAVTSTVTA